MGSRADKFRQARLLKRKYKLVFLFSFLLLILGICAADYSVNTLVKNEKRISFISIDKYSSNYYKASFLNMSFFVDTHKLSSDLAKMRNKAEDILGGINPW